jgi:hypothetical protein
MPAADMSHPKTSRSTPMALPFHDAVIRDAAAGVEEDARARSGVALIAIPIAAAASAQMSLASG